MHPNGDARGAGQQPPPPSADDHTADDAWPDAPVKYRVITRIARSPHDARYLVQRLDATRSRSPGSRVLSSDLGASPGLVRYLHRAGPARRRRGARLSRDRQRVRVRARRRGALVLTVERPQGPPLREVLEAGGRLAVPRAVRIAIQIAEVLEQAPGCSAWSTAGFTRTTWCSPAPTIPSPSRTSVSIACSGHPHAAHRRSRSTARVSAPEQASARPRRAATSTRWARCCTRCSRARRRRPRAARGRGRAAGDSTRRHAEPRAPRAPGVARLPRFRTATVSTICTSLWAEVSPYGRPSLTEAERSRAGAVLRRPMLLAASVAAAAVLTAGAGALVVWLGHDVETTARPSIPPTRRRARSADRRPSPSRGATATGRPASTPWNRGRRQRRERPPTPVARARAGGREARDASGSPARGSPRRWAARAARARGCRAAPAGRARRAAGAVASGRAASPRPPHGRWSAPRCRQRQLPRARRRRKGLPPRLARPRIRAR